MHFSFYYKPYKKKSSKKNLPNIKLILEHPKMILEYAKRSTYKVLLNVFAVVAEITSTKKVPVVVQIGALIRIPIGFLSSVLFELIGNVHKNKELSNAEESRLT